MLTDDHLSLVRSAYPALQWIAPGAQSPEVFFDGPGGTQVPQAVIDAYRESLVHANANRHSTFRGSEWVERFIDDAAEAVAAFVGAASARGIVFGANMTSLAFHLADALGDALRADDEVIVTGMDHDANIAPWVRAARRCGAALRVWPMRLPEGKLVIDDLIPLLNPKTKWVAFTAASNAIGTVTPVAEIIRAVRSQTDAMVFVDSVHLSPHMLPDAQGWDADFVALSPYKFFGPHAGVLCGKEEAFARLKAPKVRPSPSYLPDSWMTGTQNHEAIHAITAGIRHLAGLDEAISHKANRPSERAARPLRARLAASFALIRAHEEELSRRLLQGLGRIPAIRLHGVPATGPDRVSTFGLELTRHAPEKIAKQLGEMGIRTYAGNFYALSVTEALGLEGKGGLLRIGLVHYNTAAEVDALLEALGTLLKE